MKALLPERRATPLLAALRRMDRTIDIEFDRDSGVWMVTRAGTRGDRCRVNGRFQYGRHVVIRWTYPDGSYRPLDWALLDTLAAADTTRHASWKTALREIEAMEQRQIDIGRRDMADRRREVKSYIEAKIVKRRVWTCAGLGRR